MSENSLCLPVGTIVLVSAMTYCERVVVVSPPNLNGAYPVRFLRNDESLGGYSIVTARMISEGCVLGMYQPPRRKWFGWLSF